jgi:hypothetical protein
MKTKKELIEKRDDFLNDFCSSRREDNFVSNCHGVLKMNFYLFLQLEETS